MSGSRPKDRKNVKQNTDLTEKADEKTVIDLRSVVCRYHSFACISMFFCFPNPIHILCSLKPVSGLTQPLNTCRFGVSEGVEPGQLITSLLANDSDSGAFGEIR